MSSSEFDDLRITLFADIEKAFERVDPMWVLKILAAWGIDSWAYIIIAALLTERVSILKIKNG